ncbi:DUF4345 domain-containing protein [Nocardiopsis valliformis]|uniref:DUF4345 domain-containing protein n=1 Tax=Nocardiopsis valliformis TaxID=239974 RepID=UPI000345E2D3|nr:DUF4345 domain-containing protein [Nocardiopsis valliformis]
MRSLRSFQVLVILSALVLVGTGALNVVLGPTALPGDTAIGLNADSNYRFFAGVWLTLGPALLWVVPRPLERAPVLMWIIAAVFVGGLARALAALLEGVPHPFLLVLLAVELVIPPVLFLWHRALNRERNRVAGDSAAG